MKIYEEEKLRVALIGVNEDTRENYNYYMEELEALCEAVVIYDVILKVVQNGEVNNKHYIGKGKALELKEEIEENEIDLCIVNGELSYNKRFNLEKILGVEVIDRTTLILNIFKMRATTKEGQIQVEIARLKYQLPRLVGSYDNLSKQVGSGGGVFLKGAGEKKIDLDKRKIREKIYLLNEKLKKIEENQDMKRKNRESSKIKVVSLVGYTNVGKSTIMNYFVEEEKKVLEKDMLFATLDSTARRVHLKNGEEIILIDTVGFVSKLPHLLVSAFNSTLREITFSDLIVEVYDLSDENTMIHEEVVEKTLKDIKVDHIKKIQVFNKCDKVKDLHLQTNNDQINISAKSGLNMDLFLEAIERGLYGIKTYVTLEIPMKFGQVISKIESHPSLISKVYSDNNGIYELTLREDEISIYKDFIIQNEEGE